MTQRSSGSAPLVALEHCSLVLGNVTVLDDICFELRPGERWALVGANGAGKTAFLKLLRGDLWPTPLGRESRTYRVDPEAGPGGSAHPEGGQRFIGYLGPERQDRYVRRDWNLTVAQVVTTGLFDEDIPLTRPDRAQRARVARLLRRFRLWGLRRRRFLTLSYGQRRLTLVARALAGAPRVLLLDEVFNGLDEGTRRTLRSLLEQRRPRGPAWIMTTHRAEELPASITHVAHIRSGRLVEAGRWRPGTVRRPARGWRLATPSTSRTPDRTGRSNEALRPLITIRNATVYRDYRAVLKDLNWTLGPGEHWAILGRNGSGKSTLLSMLYGDQHPALGGHIERRGVPPGTHIEAWKKQVGFVSPELQADHFRAATIEEIVISGRYASIGLNDPPTVRDRAVARRWLEAFGLADLAVRAPGAVSYGQLRLALLARALVIEPVLLLLDEPFTGLDADIRGQMVAQIERQATSGTQVVLAVHHEQDLIPSVRHLLRILPGGRTRVQVRS